MRVLRALCYLDPLRFPWPTTGTSVKVLTLLRWSIPACSGLLSLWILLWVCIDVCIYTERAEIKFVLFLRSLCFESQSLTGLWGSISSTVWPVSPRDSSPHLHLPHAEITSSRVGNRRVLMFALEALSRLNCLPSSSSEWFFSSLGG